MKHPVLILALGGVLLAGASYAAYRVVSGERAEVIESEPVTVEQDVYARVIGSSAVTGVGAVPRDVCSDVAVQRRLPERDGNVGGAVAGAVIGGLLGNQVGGGDGKKLATVAGAVAGGYAGREIDRRHTGGRVVSETERRCETISEARETVVGYDVTYRTDDGQQGTLRLDRKPGERIVIGREERIIGYDVTYRYGDVLRTVRMQDDPGSHLPVIDGKVVLATDDSRPESGAGG